MSALLLPSYRLLATADPDEGQEFASRAWEKHRREVRRGRYGLAWHQSALSRSSLVYVMTRSAESIACAGPQTDVFRIGFHDSGHIEHRINGKLAVSRPDRAILHAPAQELRLESEPFRMLFLALHGDLVRRAMSRRFAFTPPIETWATEFPLYTGAAAALKSLCRWTASELERPGSVLLSSPRAAASLERSLLALLLEAMEERHPAGDTKARDLAGRQVQQIEEWMDAHLTDPVGIEDLAVVVGAGPRSLQRAFRRLRGCSPMQAFQQRRLELAKRMLEAATPATTVTDVATECGFFHLGRFSSRYRQAFGELPSLALARGKAVD